MKAIPLGGGVAALVDDQDYEGLIVHKWRLLKGHVVTDVGSKPVYMHRLIMNAPNNMEVDHIDGNRTNNQRTNLRLATRAENARNAKPYNGGTSQYKGVYWLKKQRRWRARIRVDGQFISLGCYGTEEAAAIAYDNAAVTYFGDFARLNFPPT